MGGGNGPAALQRASGAAAVSEWTWRFAGNAVWKRLATDPLSESVLDHGRTTYRPDPIDLEHGPRDPEPGPPPRPDGLFDGPPF